ncbi:tautomerase family protein [Mumia sp. Pv 4-285]|uniref:tautomerase family protein n=1 Tax=Mumia qirimensis TaxID=3234852 RepID=UPI00351D44A8
MPATHIEVRREYTAAEETAIIDAVQRALETAFLIPPQDRSVRLTVHAPHRFASSPARTSPELSTLVSIDCFAGRSLDAKRRLYTEIVERLEALGIPRDHVTILLRETAAENWGIRGGQAACDVDLGFEVRV